MQENHQWVAHKRQKPMIIKLNFEKYAKTVKTFDIETSKLQPVNLSETSSRDTAGVHQRVADYLQSL